MTLTCMSGLAPFSALINGTVSKASSRALGTATKMRYGFSSIFSRSLNVFSSLGAKRSMDFQRWCIQNTSRTDLPINSSKCLFTSMVSPAREPSEPEKSTTLPISAIQWPGLSVRTAIATMSAPARLRSRAGSGVVPVTLPKKGTYTPSQTNWSLSTPSAPPSLSIFMGALMPPSLENICVPRSVRRLYMYSSIRGLSNWRHMEP